MTTAKDAAVLTNARAFVSRNPATGKLIAAHDTADWPAVEEMLDQAATAFTRWRRTSVEHRAALVRGVADQVRTRRKELAALLTEEMGKPITEALAEVDKCVWSTNWLADNAPSMLMPQPMVSPYDDAFVAFRPLGTVLAIMPWNYPLWQFFRAGIPALLAGNCVLLKHAPNVSKCALVIEELFLAADFAPGVVSAVLMDTELAERAITDPRISAVTLTGSVGAGRAVGATAGAHVKKVVLELGGSDPFIVLQDADIEAAAQAACRARMQNNGQSCIAGKRIIVVESVAAQFLERFRAAVAALRVGDPTDPATDIGPLARRDLRDQLIRQQNESIEQGARVLVGGRPMDRPGWWYQPTVLTDVTATMPVFSEETFGPLTGVMVVPDEAAAVAAANDIDLGLGASLWTADLDRARLLSAEIEAGMVFVNAIVASDARLPFGGIKRSGLGRELSQFGVREFTNIQTVTLTSSPR
ncbi:NAD-dependent succinate-semialdehyde dehydrogenase [Streptomyces sp. NBC_01320]|uniref:NAD-dependent succinate-semialdehyde dehydrogenase n=1 Tax=Streptomyces sp. NBC_01320 TaxID=2903824 RepID=UPI002E14C77F|nr:NAD-dependent succinate-semialdehyde dehydrogenase [Streptomyces sp. NBC_01320]WSK01144.1 NAD-dependent succinate-semialdehyde dehydrogenase [Streptomyces sp. NBC_01320]